MTERPEADIVLADVPTLTADDRALIADAIRQFGSAADHPLPDDQSIRFFRVAYARDCVARARAQGGRDSERLAAVEDRLLAATPHH